MRAQIISMILLLFSLVRTPAATSDIDFPWVTPTGDSIMSITHFRAPETKYGAGHRGIDFPLKESSKVRAPVSGVVTFVGKVADRELITIKTNNGLLVSLEPVKSSKLNGDPISKGEIIGETSEGGHCLSSCVHLGVRLNTEYLNPLRFYIKKPILLPQSLNP